MLVLFATNAFLEICQINVGELLMGIVLKHVYVIRNSVPSFIGLVAIEIRKNSKLRSL